MPLCICLSSQYQYQWIQWSFHVYTTWEAHVSSRKIVLGVVDIPNLTIAFRITGKKLYFPEIMHEHFMLHPKILQQPHFMSRWCKSKCYEELFVDAGCENVTTSQGSTEWRITSNCIFGPGSQVFNQSRELPWSKSMRFESIISTIFLPHCHQHQFSKPDREIMPPSASHMIY